MNVNMLYLHTHTHSVDSGFNSSTQMYFKRINIYIVNVSIKLLAM